MEDEKNGDCSEEVLSEDEGLEMLLGGMSLSAISPAAWSNEQETDRIGTVQSLAQQEAEVAQQGNPEASETTKTVVLVDLESFVEEETYGCYDRAFHLQPNGQLVRPPVRIVDMSSTNNRGNGLVATRSIGKGEVIFTEYAAEATQLPPIQCTQSHIQSPMEVRPWSRPPLTSVRACQNCFRSLEPISSLEQSSTLSWPLPEIWSIPEYDSERDGNAIVDNGCRKDIHGRMQCISCHSLFCSQACRDKHNEKMGKCCTCSSSLTAVIQGYGGTCVAQQDTSSDSENVNGIGCSPEIHPAVILAARMCVVLLQRYRSSGKFSLEPFVRMCGSANDVTRLELGIAETETAVAEDSPQACLRFTLLPIYNALYDVLSITMEEAEFFSLELFHQLASTAARNAFAIKTRSPFRAYHAGLLRAAGGRGTDCHEIWMKQIATALGSMDGRLHRDMDRLVGERCAVEVVALFTLTARINHCCRPSAQVRNEEFVDCNVDVVATRDLQAGEEITISYIPVDRTTGAGTSKSSRGQGHSRQRARRLRELRAKYLFECDCELCSY